MTRLTLHGIATYTEGMLPQRGSVAPRFSLVSPTLEEVGLDQFSGRWKVLNIVPSTELPACRQSSRRLAEALRGLPHAVMLTISRDLPFALDRWCDGMPRSASVSLSAFRSPSFARGYGVDIVSGPLRGLLARALLVLDAHNTVRHVELVRELSDEPDGEAAVALVCGAEAPVVAHATPVSSTHDSTVAV